VTAAWSSLVDSTASVVRSYAEAVLGCVEKTARFLVSLDLCAPSEAASEKARVELPQHAAKGQPTADITYVKAGTLVVTTFSAHADWDQQNLNQAVVSIEVTSLPGQYRQAGPPLGLFVGHVGCDPASPGIRRPSAGIVIYRDGLPAQ
jgi:hypothetical protein